MVTTILGLRRGGLGSISIQITTDFDYIAISFNTNINLNATTTIVVVKPSFSSLTSKNVIRTMIDMVTIRTTNLLSLTMCVIRRQESVKKKRSKRIREEWLGFIAMIYNNTANLLLVLLTTTSTATATAAVC